MSIRIEKIEVMNFEGAFRGLRNPMESWDKSDSHSDIGYNHELKREEVIFGIGEQDLALAQKLILAGSDHSKFMRQIFVSMDITAPLYWWKEMDTYKVGTVANSCSTMHKLETTPITKDCFSFDSIEDLYYLMEESFEDYVQDCEKLRLNYIKTKDNRYWRALIQLLPSSWNQTRTWTANYAVLRNIRHSRKNHKLSEWPDFCRKIEQLPYAKELICLEEK